MERGASRAESIASRRGGIEKLCRTYWWPLYGFVRRDGYNAEEAQDLTQGFFAMLLNGAISTRSGGKKGGYVPICSRR